MNVIDRRNNTFADGQYIALRNGHSQQARTTQSSNAPSRTNIRVDGAARRGCESIAGMLDRIGCGYLVLNREKKVIEWNAAAQNTLGRPGEAVNMASELSAALRRLVANVPAHFLPGSLSWVVICSGDDRPVILTEAGLIAHDGTCIVALLDRKNRPVANPRTLQRMFGLTSAETHLALRLAQGDAPLDIARSWRLSRTTIRSQLASLFAKTETKRQAELVALLGRISVLP
ncbi:helix-turn-helix transcriptional regulator [Mesorhizobium sp. ES1-4]|uniref:helix-turn-helix transcriptional regulator n=1 Tax=Mesorhizobium sp. ES1-4 TaxID=2876627 RepID=UPI001CCEB141|nr:helix-turn-helix transcriptional regulator [Mesorhizobium sp. ES1-4]MBZ9800089.1 helix-turn-helix transcriptional regulator [Mesorhizobium sp. ES1-4]